MRELGSKIKLRGQDVPHFILNSGDDIMYLENKGHNFAIEPINISNEDYIYNQVPRAIVEVGGINFLNDQLTNPYTRGDFEFEYEDMVHSLSAEFRRIPLKISISVKYVLDSYQDVLQLSQNLVQYLAFTQTYKVAYMGKVTTCGYQLQESLEGEKNIQIDGGTSDAKHKTLSIDFDVECNYPLYEPRTVTDNGNIIRTLQHDTYVEGKKYTRIIE